MSERAPVQLRLDPAGLIPAVVQNARDGQVLMLGYMNQEALERTLTSGLVWFYSRSRSELWQKGETSGHVLKVRAVRADCDRDSLLVLAEPEGPTCHTGQPSCFFAPLGDEPAPAVPAEAARELFGVILSRRQERPQGSYVAALVDGGVDLIAKKVGEEATEVIIAAKNADPSALVREMADLWFHCYVLLAEAGLSPWEVWQELARRRR